MDLTWIFDILKSPWLSLFFLPLIGYHCWQHVYDFNDLADCVAAIGANEATIFIPNQQDINENLTIPANITLRFIQGGSLNIGKFSIRNATYKWTLSGAGTNEFYLELAAGGDPGLTDPLKVYENDTWMPLGVVEEGLSAGQWNWGDYDTLGFDTVYVRLSGSATDNTGDTTNGSPIIAGMTDTSDFNEGDHVTVSAGFPVGVHEIIAKTANSVTLDINATATVANVTVATFDPDTRAVDYVEAAYKMTINGSIEADLYQIFEGDGSVAFGAGALENVYPEWWGAIGDGTTVDNIAVQGLFSSLPSSSPPTAKISRNYLVDWIKIRETDNLIICGTGRFKNNATTGHVLDVDECNNIKIIGVEIDGNNKGTRAIDLYKSPNFIVSKCKIFNVGDGSKIVAGIYVAPECDNGKIFGNHIEDIVGTIARGVEVNNFRDNTKLSANIIIAKNTIKDISPVTDADGVNLSAANKYSNAIVEGNVFIDCYKRAVKLQTNGVIVRGNKIYKTVAGASYTVVSLYADDLVVEDNKVHVSDGYFQYMFDASPHSNLVIRNNETENPAGAATHGCYGVRLEAGDGIYQNVKINGNSFKYFNHGVYVLDDVDNLEICDNRFDQGDSHCLSLLNMTINILKITGNNYDNIAHTFINPPAVVTQLQIINNNGIGAWAFAQAVIPSQADIIVKNNIHNGLLAEQYMPIAPTGLTIAGGVISVTGSYHILTPQGGAIDDLDTINGGVDGMLLILKGDGTFQIDVKHNTGNILISGAADYLLPTTTQRILLQYDAALTKWIGFPGY